MNEFKTFRRVRQILLVTWFSVFYIHVHVSMANETAAQIAQGLIDSQSNVRNVTGDFLVVRSQKVSAGDVAAMKHDFQIMISNAHSPRMKEELKKTEEMQIRDIDADGFLSTSDSYSGVFESENRFALTKKSSADPSPISTRFTADGKRLIEYSANASQAIITRVSDPSVAGELQELDILKQWVMRPNQIGESSRVELAGINSGESLGLLSLRQAPTDFTLNRCTLTFTVSPAEGYMATHISYTNAQTGALVRTIDNQDIREIAPGIWRPLRLIITVYSETVSQAHPQATYREVLQFKTTPTVNVVVNEFIYKNAVPPGTIRIVDNTGRKSLDLELDKNSLGPDRGIDAITDELAKDPATAPLLAADTPANPLDSDSTGHHPLGLVSPPSASSTITSRIVLAVVICTILVVGTCVGVTVKRMARRG